MSRSSPSFWSDCTSAVISVRAFSNSDLRGLHAELRQFDLLREDLYGLLLFDGQHRARRPTW